MQSKYGLFYFVLVDVYAFVYHTSDLCDRNIYNDVIYCGEDGLKTLRRVLHPLEEVRWNERSLGQSAWRHRQSSLL